MKITFILITSLFFTIEVLGQSCPSTIRVGSTCSCHTCSGTIDVVNYETYVKRVLPQEWLNCWGSQTGGMNSLEAGAVAIRSYTIPRIASTVASHGGGTYDICRTTCCHVYSTTQYTNSNTAVDNTANYVLVSGSNIQLSEYAAEQNNHPTCGNGYVGDGSGSWPCTLDQPCTGQTYNGHGRGMCQNGSARWATGLDLVNSSCTWLSSHGYGTKTWQQILSHYYPNWTLTTCSAITAPVNDDCAGATTLTPNTTCINTPGDISSATASGLSKPSCDAFASPSMLDVWYKFTATATSHDIIVSPSASFDAVVALYTSCGGGEIGCADYGGGNGATETISATGLTVGIIYYIRVYDYGSVAPATTTFNICVTTSCINSTSPSSATASPSSLCSGNSSTLTVNGGSLGTGANWYWYSGSCGGSYVGSGSSISVTPSSTTTYYVRAEGTCNTTNCASTTVNVSGTQSTAPSSASASPSSLCSGNSSTLTVIGGSLGTGASWYWYSGSCGGTYVGSGNSISVTPSSTTTYYVRAEGTCNTTSCVNTSITVNSNSVAPTNVTAIPNPVIIGNQTSISVIGGSLGTSASWNWYSGGCGSTFLGTGNPFIYTPTSDATIYVRAEGTCNTTTCLSVFVDVITSIVDISFENSIKIFPNPTSGSLTIENNSGVEIEKIEIYNTLGQKVYSTSNIKHQTSNIINVHSLATGIYNLQLTTSKGVINKQVVMEKRY